MRTTATNKRLRELLYQIGNGTLVPNPSFQRRLVWANKHKVAFVKTVLEGLPFPEIYVAAGDVNLETGQSQTMLVDGQQRITTLYEYFTASPNFKIPRDVRRYNDLSEQEKLEFLDYDVVVRDLGKIPIEQVIKVFERINSTSYSLNAIEIANARYDNPLKDTADALAAETIWEEHKVFSANEIKRMQDSRFTLGLIITVMSDYFNRDDLFEDYLIRFNDEAEMPEEVEKELETTIGFLKDCSFGDDTRIWKKADLFTALVEFHRTLFRESLRLDVAKVARNLNQFYFAVDNVATLTEEDYRGMWLPGEPPVPIDDVMEYYDSALQATNDRLSRVRRGQIVTKLLRLSQSEDAVLTAPSVE